MNQIAPGKMAGKPAASRAARKQGLEIAFDPDAEPLAEMAPDPFPSTDEPGQGPKGPAGDESRGEGVRDGAVRRAPRSAGAAGSEQQEPGDDALSATEALSDGPTPGQPEAQVASHAGPRTHSGADAPQPARHADPAEAARALGIPLPLAKIEVTVSVEVGRTRLSLADLVSVEPGELVALDRMTNAPVDILVNGKPFARGEIVAIGERFGVRLTELLEPGDLA